MVNEAQYIVILCGVFGDNYAPLTRSEFWKLYHKYGDSVEDLVESGEARVEELLRRSASVTFALEKLHQMGIKVTTIKDESFPQQLLTKLGDFCPPLLYFCGDSEIRDHRFAGYVGSRTISNEDVRWTEMMINKNISQGFGIVTGGAKGIDNVSLVYALNEGGKVVVFLPDNIQAKLRDSFYQQNIIEGNLLVYSHVSPFEKRGKNTFVASAMERNKLIYALSSATAVVKSDYNKGGTWAGATEALRHHWTQVFAWDNKEYLGNQKLIELGAKPLSDRGERVEIEDMKGSQETIKNDVEQLSLFDLLE